MRRLPPLDGFGGLYSGRATGLRKVAAEELALSTPALVVQSALERYTGRPCLIKKHQALEINEDGTALLNDIAPALDPIAVSVTSFISEANQLRLRHYYATLRRSDCCRCWAIWCVFPLHIDIETTPHPYPA